MKRTKVWVVSMLDPTMRTLIWTALVLSALILSVPGAGAAEAEVSADETTATCLACHGGSLEALAEKTKDYKDDWGDPVNPHVGVDKTLANPHASKTPPACTNCHEAHPVPPQPGMKVKKADVTWCYGCHHMETFEPCGQSGCHEKK